MAISGIYAILNIITGKFYVGSAIRLNKRWQQHSHLLNKNKHDNVYLQRSFNKHGSCGFIYHIIECCGPEVLLEREQYWINELNCNDPAIGYNIRKIVNTNLGIKYNLKSPKRIKGHFKEFPSVLKGKPKSKAHIKKMSEVQKGRKFSEIHLANLRKSLSLKKYKFKVKENKKYPCLQGQKCKCLECMRKKADYQKRYYHRLMNKE